MNNENFLCIFHNGNKYKTLIVRNPPVKEIYIPFLQRQAILCQKWLHKTIGRRNVWEVVIVHQMTLRLQL